MRIAKSNSINFPRFALDNDKNFFFGNDCYFIVGRNLEYLWLLLNSTLCGYLFRYYIYSFDQTGFKIFTDYFQNLPFPIDNDLSEIVDLTSELNYDKIDKYVYGLFGFDNFEIEEIENSVQQLLNSIS